MLINATPHVLTVFAADTTTVLLTLPPSGTVARCAVTRTAVGDVDGVPVTTAVFGELSGLPEPREGTTYIVSLVAHQRAVQDGRTDTLSPGELVRRPDGQPIGCVGLSR